MQRKLFIGFGFLFCSTYLIAIAIYKGISLVELSTSLGAMAGGVGFLMYGFAQEYKNAAPKPPSEG